MTLRAVLFDFDGTLADSYPAIAASVNDIRSGHGLPPLPTDEVRKYVGRGPAYLLESTVPGANVTQSLARYRAHHPSVMRSGTHLYPGTVEALATLKHWGLRLGVCSNKPVAFTRELLGFFGLAPLMDLALGPEDVPRPKPAPDIIKMALTRLGVAAEDTLYVGDMVVDIQTARAAGVAVWVVPTGSDDCSALQAGQPDRMLHDLRELPACLQQATPPGCGQAEPKPRGPFA